MSLRRVGVMTTQKVYRPSTGTEADKFDARFCSRCERDRAYRDDCDGTTPGCVLIAMALVFDTDDADYPVEWTYADGKPTCTAFVEAPCPT
jgi:hypothetical protein